MIDNKTDPTTFYISIASSVAFLISESLPFVEKTKSNGILHSIKVLIDNYKKTQVSDEIIGTIKNDITTIKNDIDTKTKETDSFIVNIKSDVNDIKNEIADIKTNIKDIKTLFDQSEIV
jgi:archaellum component FlaC